MADVDLTTDATLNGESITITVKEDTTGDGNADNTASQAIGSGTNTYTLSGFDISSGNELWWTADFSTSIEEASAVLNSVKLEASSSGGSTTVSKTWETASDWDGAVSETGVAHESVANTDHSDGALVQKGFSYGSPLYQSDLAAYFPLHGNAKDISGNGNDGTINGPSADTGLLGTQSMYFNRSNGDWIEVPDDSTLDISGDFTISAWVKIESLTDYPRVALKGSSGGGDGNYDLFHHSSGGWTIGSSGTELQTGTDGTTGTWEFVVGISDGGTLRFYLDGTDIGSTSAGSPSTNNTSLRIGTQVSGNNHFPGNIWDLRIYERALTASEVQDLYDVVDTPGELTTGTKTFSEAVKPDLSNLDYSLNSGSITLDVIGSPGTASEEIVSQSLDGSASYDLTWNESHTDFSVKLSITKADITSTPTFNSGTLEATTSGSSSDADQNPNTTWEIRGARYDASGNEYEGGGVVSRYGG